MASLFDIDPYAVHFAKTTGVAQVVWYCASVDTYGRTPLPEWNRWHANSPNLQVVNVVQPDAKR